MPRNPSLRHVYGRVSGFNDWLVTNGGVLLTNASNNARKLVILDEVSRLIDARAHRGSGFGPWVGSKSYDGDGGTSLWLRADLAVLDEVTAASTVGADPSSLTVETDFYLAGLGGYEAPYRRIILNGTGSRSRFGTGLRLTTVTGSWSYPYRTTDLEVTVGADIDDSVTSIGVSDLGEIEAGMTLLIDDEQVYVTATTDDTPDSITVERAVNGTTAAAHSNGAAISTYVYDSSVVDLTYRLAEKRWKARDAGADGTDSGPDIGTVSLREGEDTIIRRMIGATVMLTGYV